MIYYKAELLQKEFYWCSIEECNDMIIAQDRLDNVNLLQQGFHDDSQMSFIEGLPRYSLNKELSIEKALRETIKENNK